MQHQARSAANAVKSATQIEKLKTNGKAPGFSQRVASRAGLGPQDAGGADHLNVHAPCVHQVPVRVEPPQAAAVRKALGLHYDAQQRRRLHVAAALHVILDQFAAAGREPSDEKAGQVAGLNRPLADPRQAFHLCARHNEANRRRSAAAPGRRRGGSAPQMQGGGRAALRCR